MHQVRLVKEMREATNGRYPRFMVWENVKGALSSNKGEDFRTVLEKIVQIKSANATIPRPANGKWNKSGCIVGDDFSVAWRLHDAQYWGVAQRRERIALVADFGGLTAPEILFEPKSLLGETEASKAPREETSNNARSSIDQTVYCLQGNGIDRANSAKCNGARWRTDVSYTLNTIDRPAVCASFNHNAGSKSDIGYSEERSVTLKAGQVSAVYDTRGNGKGNISPTLTGDHQSRITDYTALCVGNGQPNNITMSQQSNTLDTMHDQQCVWVPNVAHCLKAKANCDYREDSETYISQDMTVRRLTPLECERLQGLPDHWTDIGDWIDSKGKKHKSADTPRYKAIGNGIALPFWEWMLNRLCSYFNYAPTLGSLFDGIGSFPLIWERINGKSHTLWASEIEEFPIAVTKFRFSVEKL